MHCGLIWCCPVCSARIRGERAKEVQAVLAWHAGKHGTEGAQLLTLTARHQDGDDLATLRTGIAKAYRRLVRGEPWAGFIARVGLVGFVRALEVTHGRNGWHPHLHVLLLVRDPATLAGEVEWLRERWHTCVVRELGTAAEPNAAHGLDLRPCHHVEYLAKLGLEVTAPGEKNAKNGNRTPWEILADIGASQRAEDVYLWQTWCNAMKGARMLTWSQGLRDAAGLSAERTDQEILEDKEAGAPIVNLPGATWDRLRDVRGLPAALLTACERGGYPAVEAMLVRYLGPPPEMAAAWAVAARAGS